MLAFYRTDPENIFNLSSSVSNITFDPTIINNLSNEEIFYISATGNTTETVLISSSNELFGYSSSSFELIAGQSPIPIELVFSPDTIGQKSGILYLSSSNGDTLNISLSGLAIPEPLILKSSVENIYFPSLYLGSSSQTTFTVTADEDNIETVVLSDDSDQFSFSPASFVLTGGVTIQTVTASFNPTSLGSKTGNLTLTSTSGSTLIIQLDGACVHTPLVLTSSVSVLSFSGTFINTTSSNTFTVSAAGSGQIENITVTDNTNQFNFSPSNFYLTGGGSPQIINVNFIPTSTGVKSGLIIFSSSGGDLLDVALSGSGIIAPLFLTSSVESLVFPETSLRTIKRKTFNVTAGGSGSALVFVRESLPDFQRSPPSFSLIGSDTSPDVVTITFYPYSYGTKTGLVTLSSSQGQLKYIQVTGTCSPPPAILRLNKTNMIFPSTSIGSSSSQTFIVSAAGTVNETVTITDNSSYFSFNPSNFSLSGNNPSVIVTGSFSPDSKNLFTGLVTVSASRGSVKTLRVTGSGIYAPLILTSSVNSIDFGTFYVGTSNFISYDVSAGGLNSEIVTISDNSSQFSFNALTFPLTGGGPPYSVTASFNPTRTGLSTGIMTLSASGGNIKNISLTGSAVYAPLVITSSTNVLNFPNTALNSSSSLSFTISAGGIGGTETITLIDDSTDFNFSPSNFNLSAGGSETITGTFLPIIVGNKTGSLIISSSGGDIKNISLSGTAVNVQQLTLSSSKTNLNFGNVAVGSSSVQTFVVSATSGIGTETINVSSSNNIFVMSPASFNLTGSGDSRTVSASFSPSSITSSFGTITLSASGGDIETITVSGSGIDPFLSFTSLILRGDGTEGSTTFLDSGPYNVPISFVNTGSGQVFISTQQSKFGGSSIFFNGSGSLLNIGTGSAVNFAPLNLDTGSWTFEVWCWPISSSLTSKTIYGDYGLASTASTNRYIFRFLNGKFGVYHRNGSVEAQTTSIIPFNTWSHLAVSRTSSGILRVFYNGNMQLEGSFGRDFEPDPQHSPTVGGFWQNSTSYSPQGWYAGYIENLRITKGFVRYTGSFTPPGAY